MTEFLTIPELKAELHKLQQAKDNEDITDQAFEAGAADLHARIKAREFANAKQRTAREMDTLYKTGQISRQQYSRALVEVHLAQNEADLHSLNLQNLAA